MPYSSNTRPWAQGSRSASPELEPHEALRLVRAKLVALSCDFDPVAPLPPPGVDPRELARMMRDPAAISANDMLAIMLARLPDIVDDAERVERRPLASTIFAAFNTHAASGELAFRLALGGRSEREIRLRIDHALVFGHAAGAPSTFHVHGSDPQYMRTLLSFVETSRRANVEAWCARPAPPHHVHVVLFAGEQSATHLLKVERDASTARVVAVRRSALHVV